MCGVRQMMCLAVLMCACAGPLRAASNSWSSNGPYAGTVDSLAVDGQAPPAIFAATRYGVFRSLDSGLNWTRIERGLPPIAVGASRIAAAQSSRRLFLGSFSARVFRSDDGGDNWLPASPPLTADDILFNLSLAPGSDTQVAVSATSGAYVTADAGATWIGPGTASGLPSLDPFVAFTTVVHTGSAIYVGLDGETSSAPGNLVYKSTNGGASWQATATLAGAGDPLEGSGLLDLAASRLDANRVFVTGVNNAAAYSTDGGASWNVLTLPGACANVGGLGAWALEPSRTSVDGLWLGCFYGGVFYTGNLGLSWTSLGAGLTANTAGDPAAVVDILLHPTDPQRLWAATAMAGVYFSTSGGLGWIAVNQGLVVSSYRTVAIHPTSPATMWVGQSNEFPGNPAAPGLFRTSDGAQSWSPSNTGLNAEFIRSVALDPTTAATPAATHLYSVGFSTPLTGPSSKDGGIYKSTNGGASWTTIDTGIKPLPDPNFPNRRPNMRAVRAVVLDPRSCAAPPPTGPCLTGPLQTVYVGGQGLNGPASTGAGGVPLASERIYKSVNAGANWSPSETGLPLPLSDGSRFVAQLQVFVMAIDPVTPSTLYAGTILFWDISTDPIPTLANGVFKSTDAGATWVHSSSGLPTYGGAGTSNWDVSADGLAVNPANPQTLYASVNRGTVVDLADGEGRVYKSLNGGGNWINVSSGLYANSARGVVIDPSDPSGNTVYVSVTGFATKPARVYKTTDGGASWDSISVGLGDRLPAALHVVPGDAARLLGGGFPGVLEFSQISDSDRDDVADSVEDAGPGGAAGDADGDGVVNRLDSDTAVLPSAGVATPYVTIDVLPAAGCARLDTTEAIPELRLPRDDTSSGAATHAAYAAIGFELPLCGTAQVDVSFAGADFTSSEWSWRNYGPTTPGDLRTFAWYTFAGASKLDADTWRLTLSAAQPGSWTTETDRVVFHGGPLFTPDLILSDGLE